MLYKIVFQTMHEKQVAAAYRTSQALILARKAKERKQIIMMTIR